MTGSSAQITLNGLGTSAETIHGKHPCEPVTGQLLEWESWAYSYGTQKSMRYKVQPTSKVQIGIREVQKFQMLAIYMIWLRSSCVMVCCHVSNILPTIGYGCAIRWSDQDTLKDVLCTTANMSERLGKLIQLNEQGQVSGPKNIWNPLYYFIGFSINELQNGEFWVTEVMEASRVGRFPRLVTQGLDHHNFQRWWEGRPE